MKRQVVSSNWRDDLSEYVDISNVSPRKKAKTDTKSREKVEEKEVNNKVVINPPMTEAFEELGGIIISVTEELSKEEMEEMEDKKDKKEGRKPGKVEESNTQMKINQLMAKESAMSESEDIVAKLNVKRATVMGKLNKQLAKAEAQAAKNKRKDDQEQDQMQERTMTPGEKKKETDLKNTYDKSKMKDNMQDQYGKEEGKRVYFATIRKQAMESAPNPFQVHFDKDGKEYKSKGTPAQAKDIAKKISANRKSGPMKYDPENDTKGT